MKAQPAPAASAAIAIPSISWCGFFCISSRSLNAPGSDSSALQHRYFAISPRGRNEAFFPIEKPAPPRPRSPDSSSIAEQLLRLQLLQRPLQRAVAAEAPVGVDRGQPGLVDVPEEHPRLRHRLGLLTRGSGSGSGPPAAGRLGERLVRQDLGAGAKLLDRGPRVAGGQRPVVALVDRGHRRDVAGPQALEALHEDLAVGRAGAAVVGLVGIGAGGLAEGVAAGRRRPASSRRCCGRRAPGGVPPGWSGRGRRRSRAIPGSRGSRPSPRPPGGCPPGCTSRSGAAPPTAPGARRSGSAGSATSPSRSARRSSSGTSTS